MTPLPLPACEFRGPPDGGGHHPCSCPDLIVSPPGVRAEDCAGCYIPRRKAAGAGDATPAPAAAAPRPGSARDARCDHLGKPATAEERRRLALDLARDWRHCDKGHGIVCPCGRCQGCDDYEPEERSEKSEVGREKEAKDPISDSAIPTSNFELLTSKALAALVDDPAARLPDGWAHWPHAADAFRLAFRAACTRPTPYPAGRFAGRGVVICAGGWRFLPGVFVTASMLRWLGCTLPVEVFYIGGHGEYDPCFEGFTCDLGVTWRDASAELARLGVARREPLQGWPLKPLAALLSSFEEVLALDADCYPVLDPTYLFDHPAVRAAGAYFTPDIGKDRHGAPLTPCQWRRFGIEGVRTPGLESGQFLVDKRRCWHELSVACWLNDRTDYLYWPHGPAGLYGDKDTFSAAWHGVDRFLRGGAGRPYALAPAARWHHVAFLQHDPDGRVLFVHRCRDKPKVERHEFCTAQHDKYGCRRIDAAGGVGGAPLAHEWKFHELLGEYRRLLRPVELPAWRPGTDDEDTWREVRLLNAYRLPERFEAGAVVIDVGAHIGLFAREALRRGAAAVHCHEPWRPNRELLLRNVAGLPVTVSESPVWSPGAGVSYAPPTLPGRTNYGTCAGGGDTPAIGLDEAIARAVSAAANGRVAFLKLDCEGCEYPALQSATLLHLVDRVAGEWHGGDPAEIAAKLESAGFAVEITRPSSEALGLFFAKRPEVHRDET